MSSPDPPPILSFVLQSKRALKQSELLCTHANEAGNQSGRQAVDILAMDARLGWGIDGVAEQLELAETLAKSIEDRRARLVKEVKEWDALRTRKTLALDTVLDELSAQRVPLGFWRGEPAKPNNESDHPFGALMDDGLFGDQTFPKMEGIGVDHYQKDDYKTLRDFVDEKALENILETMEDERGIVDDILSQTEAFPETLTTTICSIRESLPSLPSTTSPLLSLVTSSPSEMRVINCPDDIVALLTAQDTHLHKMAAHLESLTSHYDAIQSALDIEDEFASDVEQEEIDQMNRDTEELPVILNELEGSGKDVTNIQNLLRSIGHAFEQELAHLGSVVEDLEELGEIMAEMLSTQEHVESSIHDKIQGLHSHLYTIDDLNTRFAEYKAAYGMLVQEIKRRREYRDGMRGVVQRIEEELQSRVRDELSLRAAFNTEYGSHLPEDICLCVGNSPTRWQVVVEKEQSGESDTFSRTIGGELNGRPHKVRQDEWLPETEGN